MLIKRGLKLAAILVTTLVGTTYIFVGSANAGVADIKKEEAVKAAEIKKVEVKAVNVEPVVKEVKVEKAKSDNAVFVRNPFFIRRINPFIFDEDLFFGD